MNKNITEFGKQIISMSKLLEERRFVPGSTVILLSERLDWLGDGAVSISARTVLERLPPGAIFP